MIEVIEIIQSMRRNKLDNYVLEGLSSSLLGGKDAGCVRLFESEREHQSQITPHSHRFDLACLVLSGEVKNILWESCSEYSGDLFEEVALFYKGDVGVYDQKVVGRGWYRPVANLFSTDDWYCITHDRVHSIQFSRGAKVLIFESPQKTEKSLVLEPVINNRVIPTLKVEDWMFIKS